jgi:hypothetical protein
MRDDLNVEKALAAYWSFVEEMVEAELSREEVEEVRKVLLDLDRVLGLVYTPG